MLLTFITQYHCSGGVLTTMAKRRKRVQPQKKKPISPTTIMVVVIAIIAVVGGLIAVSLGQGGTTTAEPTDLAQFPTKGEPDAPVTIVEYSDYR